MFSNHDGSFFMYIALYARVCLVFIQLINEESRSQLCEILSKHDRMEREKWPQLKQLQIS